MPGEEHHPEGSPHPRYIQHHTRLSESPERQLWLVLVKDHVSMDKLKVGPTHSWLFHKCDKHTLTQVQLMLAWSKLRGCEYIHTTLGQRDELLVLPVLLYPTHFAKGTNGPSTGCDYCTHLASSALVLLADGDVHRSTSNIEQPGPQAIQGRTLRKGGATEQPSLENCSLQDL